MPPSRSTSRRWPGVSESPFRRLCRRFGADVVVTEFLSAEGIRRENEATISKLRFGPDERPIGVQIFGADPAAMGEAAAFVTDVFAARVHRHQLRLPGQEGRQAQRRLRLPQGSRSRAGRHSRRRAEHVAAGHVQDPQRLERGDARSGHDRAALPGRRRARARAAPAHAHADVHGQRALGGDRRRRRTRSTSPCSATATSRRPQDAVRMRRETGCAGIMIARGSFGQPWIFDQTRDLLEGRPMRPAPSVEERFAIALDHARMADDYEPDRRGAAIEFRKHLGWYVKGLPGSAELRKKLHAVNSLGEVEGIFDEYLRIARHATRRRIGETLAGRRAARDRGGMRREHVRDLLRAGRGRHRSTSRTRSTRWRSSRSSRSASRRSTITARCGRDFRKSSTARGRRPSRSCEIARAHRRRAATACSSRASPPDAARPAARRRLPDVEVNAVARTAYLAAAAMPPPRGHGNRRRRHRGDERSAGRRGGRGHARRAGRLRGARDGRRRRGHSSRARAARGARVGGRRDRRRGDGWRAAVGGRRTGARAGDRGADERRVRRVVSAGSRRC